MKVLLLSIFIAALAACKQAKNSTKQKEEMSAEAFGSDADKRIQEMLDSLKDFKPIKLNIVEERSDVDELIPLGINNHGSFAYMINENSGGSSAMQFGILPSYEDFKLLATIDRDDDPDSILYRNKELIYYGLRSQQIRMQNNIQKISLDSLQKKYGIKFNVKKTYGAPDPDWDEKRKLLASVLINYHRGTDSTYPSPIIDSKYSMAHGVYDVYISDCFIIPWGDSVSGFVVLVTEGLGFEGYIRKSIELISLGVITG